MSGAPALESVLHVKGFALTLGQHQHILPWHQGWECPQLCTPSAQSASQRGQALQKENPQQQPVPHQAAAFQQGAPGDTWIQSSSGALQTFECHLQEPPAMVFVQRFRTLFKSRTELTEHVPPILQLGHLWRIKRHQLFK